MTWMIVIWLCGIPALLAITYMVNNEITLADLLLSIVGGWAAIPVIIIMALIWIIYRANEVKIIRKRC